MYKIIISGYYGFGNAGDEAMLAAILEALREAVPELDVTVISGNPTLTEKKHGVKAIGRFSAWSIVKALSRADLFLSGGGSLLQNVTSSRSLYYYLSLLFLATVMGKKVMLYAQGIGPLCSQFAKRSVAKVLNRVTYITVRDARSKAELETIGVTKVPIELTADAVLSMHPVDKAVGQAILAPHGLDEGRKKLGIAVRPWKNVTDYRAVFARLFDRLHSEGQCDIVFIPMQHPEDTAEGEAIAALMEEPATVLSQEFSTSEFLSLAGCMDLVLAVRLHALVFASLMAVPTVGISYDPKIDNFLQMIGQEAVGNLAQLDEQVLYEALTEGLKHGTIKEETAAKVSQLQAVSQRNAQRVLSVLQAKS